MTLIARFTVDSFEPRQVAGLDADWFGLMTFAKTFAPHRQLHPIRMIGTDASA